MTPAWMENSDAERFTDAGNARRLVAKYSGLIRYCVALGLWLVFDGRRWKTDPGAIQLQEYAKAVAADVITEALRDPDGERRKKGLTWGMQSESASRVRAAVELARSEPGIPVAPDDLDRNEWLFNVANGTIDLRNGLLRPHNPADLITKLAPVAYKPDAACPRWETFLEEIQPNGAVRGYLKRAVGYAFTGSTREQVMLMPYGPGSGGKSTTFETLLGVMGDYGRQADPEILLVRENAHPTGIADLQGARLVVTSESDEGRRLAEATVKRLTGDKIIKARFMRGDFFEFTATHKLFLLTNHRPVIKGTDYAIWRRLRLIPFTVTIPPEKCDKQLGEKLMKEKEGILRWAVEGCIEWQREGLNEPETVTVATAGYRADMDILGAFLEDECIVSEIAVVGATDLYQAYDRWCEASGERSVNQRRFGQALTERGFDRRKYGAANRWHWFGIGLLTNPSDPSDPDSGIDAHAGAYARGIGTKGRMGSLGSSDPPQDRLPYRESD